ncbi:MAG: transcriptional regulator [Armatimonadota bacterium]|nr:transcriptional regulator [bacterium]
MPFDYRELDPILESRMRVGILALLLNGDSVDFVHMRDRMQATDGNLARHLRRLEEADYVKMEKSFIGRRPCTSYVITDKGREALRNHVKTLGDLII